MAQQELFISIDGGGTKTDTVLFSKDGKVLKRAIGGPSNSSVIGFRRSAQTLQALLEELLSECGGLNTSICSVFAGIAGGGVGANTERYRKLIKDLLPNVKHICNGNDAINALNSGVGTKDGMALIAGTGSAVYTRSQGKVYQVGGWGHLFGDEGSGYDIASRGLRRVLMAIDGRASYTVMCELFADHLGRSVVDAILDIYDGGKHYVASLAPIVFKAADKGDEAAINILKECANELRSMLLAGCRYLETTPYHVVLTGGIWKAGNGLLENFLGEITDDRFVFIHPALPPVYGGAIEAMSIGGYEITDEFEANFARTFNLVQPEFISTEKAVDSEAGKE